MKKYNYDYSKLKGRIRELFETQESYSNAINRSSTSINDKLNNKKCFTQEEIKNSIKVLDISISEISQYFFTENVEKN